MRKINSLGIKNKQILRNIFGFKNIKQAIKDFNVKDDEDAYEIMQILYNQRIDEERNEIKIKNLQNKNNIKPISHLLNLSNPTTKLSREQRILSKQSGIKENNIEIVKDVKRMNRKEFKSALNNTYEDVEFKLNINQNNIFNLIYDTILKKIINKHNDKNLNVNIYVAFEMIKNNTEFILTFNYNSINVERVISPNQIKEWVELEIEMLMNRIEEYVRSSDLIFQKFTLLSVQFSWW